MQAKIKKGTGFKGALRYVINKDGSVFLSTNMASVTPEELAREFQSVRCQRDAVKKAVFHCSLSLPVGEHVTDDVWDKISSDYLNGMGFSNSQYVVVRHTDTSHEHIHIVANRVTYNGDVVSDKNDRAKANRVCAKLEKKYNLSLCNHGELEHNNTPKISKTDEAMGFDIAKEKIISGIDAALLFSLDNDDEFDPESFSKACKNEGIATHYNKDKNGKIRGCSFSLVGEKRKFSGSKLRKDLTIGNIKKRFQSTVIKANNISNGINKDHAKVFINAMAENGVITTKEAWGFRLHKGNWNAVIFDDNTSLTVKGYPKPEATAEALITMAKAKGWKAISIDDADEITREILMETAKTEGIQITGGKDDEITKITIADVLNNDASEEALAQQQRGGIHEINNEIKSGVER